MDVELKLQPRATQGESQEGHIGRDTGPQGHWCKNSSMTAVQPRKRMNRRKACQNSLAAMLMVTITAAPVHALDVEAEPERSNSPAIDQLIYKGVIGNVLEALPLEAEDRVHLQRGNAVVTNTFTGRSLGLLLGLASPLLMVSGFVWGLWSAANIKSPVAGSSPAPVSDAVLIPTKFGAVADASPDFMEAAIRALIALGGGE